MCGRYFTGDIEGKFWFAVQASDDASFFGGESNEPNYLDYYFRKEDLTDIKKGIDKCKKELGGYKEKIDTFFKENSAYSDEQLAEYLKIDSDIREGAKGQPEEYYKAKIKEQTKLLLEWYARLELGEKILKCVEEKGYCEFQAEL
jgi:hypothetical protein